MQPSSTIRCSLSALRLFLRLRPAPSVRWRAALWYPAERKRSGWRTSSVSIKARSHREPPRLTENRTAELFFPPFLSSLLVTKANLTSRKKSESRSFSQIVLASKVHGGKKWTSKPVGNFTRGTWNSTRTFWRHLNKRFMELELSFPFRTNNSANRKWPIRTRLWELWKIVELG